MEKEKNIILMELFCSKVSIKMNQDMEKEKNILQMVTYILKGNIYIIINGIEKEMIQI